VLTIIGITLLVLIGCFGFVLLFGAPYLPTLTVHMEQALDLAELQPGELLLELGCGDGKVVAAAAQRGLRVVGYELNPLLVLVSKLRCLRYGKQVSIRWANFWTQDWPDASGIFVFVLPRMMSKLDTKIVQYKHKPVKLVSFAFEMPGRKPARQGTGVYVYEYKKTPGQVL
jgi:16S rRNA A1518/A1519 N6-dimethyltransferase RsmA/KsgA/DIM1 with predicted DNA glycosylase/AP lyase activity